MSRSSDGRRLDKTCTEPGFVLYVARGPVGAVPCSKGAVIRGEGLHVSDHPFERLGDQRFQELCQAILSTEFPRAICLPVAQPDGGRDALSRVRTGGKRETLIFQIKFARNPDRLADPERWVRDIIDAELPKIVTLAERGATEYFLLTNLSGTAHLDSGSVDRVQKELDQRVPLAATCWWRETLNSRLDRLFDLKFQYPELFTGQDMIRVLAERGSNGDTRRRALTLRAFLSEQHRKDRSVRFKQVDFRDALLSAFVDVPASVQLDPNRKPAEAMRDPLVRRVAEIATERDEAVYDLALVSRLDLIQAGTSSILLDRGIVRQAPRVVVEGAPGQGKSTLVQYVCQVHRMRFLGRESEVDRLPTDHAESTLRLRSRWTFATLPNG